MRTLLKRVCDVVLYRAARVARIIEVTPNEEVIDMAVAATRGLAVPRLRFAGVTLLLSMGITAAYHLGYLNWYAERGGGTASLPLAAAWGVLAGTIIYLERRLFPTQAR